MTAYIALVRAVNVGGRGNLTMPELQALCVGCGLDNVRTYIQSGNVVFDSSLPERTLARQLERVIADKLRRPIGVLIRTAAEMRAVRDANPFPDADRSLIGVVFMPKPVPQRVLDALDLGGPEDVRMIGREVFVHYPDGIGRSKLKLPFAQDGTTRNMHTVAKLADMASSGVPAAN